MKSLIEKQVDGSNDDGLGGQFRSRWSIDGERPLVSRVAS